MSDAGGQSVALTREQVLALAPDGSSIKAADGLTADSKWGLLGADDGALWGECKGSGAKPYQAAVDLPELVSRCSCPSRKFPCKHALALLLLHAAGNPRCVAQPRPPWVEEWLQGRRERAARKQVSVAVAPAAAAVDTGKQAAAAARRVQTRWATMQAGAAELERWISDLFRRGLANAGAQFEADARRMMARMVDAQAPGLAGRIERLLQTGGASPAALARGLGLLQLLTAATARADSLGVARQADLRSALGWPLEREAVLRDGEAVADRWHVQGRLEIAHPGNLFERRTWLHGLDSGRAALLQDYSHGTRAWAQNWRVDGVVGGTVRFHPGTVPLRAVAEVLEVDADGAAPRENTLDAAAHAHARNPWLLQVPMRLAATRLAHDGQRLWAVHPEGTLPVQLPALQGWQLLAFSGGHPLCLMGEWDGQVLQLLSAWDAQGACWQRRGE